MPSLYFILLYYFSHEYLCNFRLKVAVFYDDRFKAQHGSKSESKVRQVMAVVNNMYSEKATLTTTIDIQIVGIEHATGQDWSGDFYAAL